LQRLSKEDLSEEEGGEGVVLNKKRKNIGFLKDILEDK